MTPDRPPPRESELGEIIMLLAIGCCLLLIAKALAVANGWWAT